MHVLVIHKNQKALAYNVYFIFVPFTRAPNFIVVKWRNMAIHV